MRWPWTKKAPRVVINVATREEALKLGEEMILKAIRRDRPPATGGYTRTSPRSWDLGDTICRPIRRTLAPTSRGMGAILWFTEVEGNPGIVWRHLPNRDPTCDADGHDWVAVHYAEAPGVEAVCARCNAHKDRMTPMEYDRLHYGRFS